MENYKPRKYIIMLMIDVLADDDDDVVVDDGGARCFLMLKFAEIHRTQFSRMRLNTRIERTNPICLMNHFSVFNANYGRSFFCSRFKHVCTRMRLCDCRLFQLFHSHKNIYVEEKIWEHAISFYTLCVLRESHFIFFATQSKMEINTRLSEAIVKMELNNIPLFRFNWFLMGAFDIFNVLAVQLGSHSLNLSLFSTEFFLFEY